MWQKRRTQQKANESKALCPLSSSFSHVKYHAKKTQFGTREVLVLGIIFLLIVNLLWQCPQTDFPSYTVELSKEADFPCSPERPGVIVLNTLGLLANDLIEIAYAKRMALDLCWPIVYRPKWNFEIPSLRGHQCFPNADIPLNVSVLPQTVSRSVMNQSLWSYLVPAGDTALSNQRYDKWIKKQVKQGRAMHFENAHFDFSGNFSEDLVHFLLRGKQTAVRVLSLSAFFINFDWMKPQRVQQKMKHWLAMNEDECCHHRPPSNAVVVHVRDFGLDSIGEQMDGTNVKASVITGILRHFNLSSRPLWIVCQPASRNSNDVLEMAKAHTGRDSDVEIIWGTDQYDAFCTLKHAKTLIVSPGSTFSQMAALLANVTDVHYALRELYRPRVVMKVPGWRYHLTDPEGRIVKEWDIDHDRITPGIF